MENASKALIFVASTLIAIMLMAFMVYTFRRFGTTARNTEKRWSDQEIEAFNSKFLSYDTGGTYSVDDVIGITEYNNTGSRNIRDITYRRIFVNNIAPGSMDATRYCKALIAASQNLNTVYDAVTAINDAIDINDKNNNGYRYNQLELQNSVEIIVDLVTYKSDFSFNKKGGNQFQYLIIEPNRNVKSRHIYGTNGITTSGVNESNKKNNAELDIFKSNNEINVYDMLDELRTTKVVNQDGKSYTVYKYYFFGQTIFNDFTGKIETVKFTLVKDKNF